VVGETQVTPVTKPVNPVLQLEVKQDVPAALGKPAEIPKGDPKVITESKSPGPEIISDAEDPRFSEPVPDYKVRGCDFVDVESMNDDSFPTFRKDTVRGSCAINYPNDFDLLKEQLDRYQVVSLHPNPNERQSLEEIRALGPTPKREHPTLSGVVRFDPLYEHLFKLLTNSGPIWKQLDELIVRAKLQEAVNLIERSVAYSLPEPLVLVFLKFHPGLIFKRTRVFTKMKNVLAEPRSGVGGY